MPHRLAFPHWGLIHAIAPDCLLDNLTSMYDDSRDSIDI